MVDKQVHEYVAPGPIAFDPAEFGLRPDEIPADAWLYRESHGDRRLMEYLKMREEYNSAERQRQMVDDQQTSELHSLRHAIAFRITERRQELGLEPRPQED